MIRILSKLFMGWDSVFDVLPTVVIVALIYWFSRRKKHRKAFGEDFKEIRKKVRLNEIIRLLFVCYITGVACMTLFTTQFWGCFWRLQFREMLPHSFRGWRGFRFVPSWWYAIEDKRFFRDFLRYEFISQIENIIFFIPMGFLLPLVWKKANFAKTVLIGFACTSFIEIVVQPFMNRDPTIDDIICNTLGTVLGYLMYLLMKKIFPKFTEKCKTGVIENQSKEPL